MLKYQNSCRIYNPATAYAYLISCLNIHRPDASPVIIYHIFPRSHPREFQNSVHWLVQVLRVLFLVQHFSPHSRPRVPFPDSWKSKTRLRSYWWRKCFGCVFINGVTKFSWALDFNEYYQSADWERTRPLTIIENNTRLRSQSCLSQLWRPEDHLL